MYSKKDDKNLYLFVKDDKVLKLIYYEKKNLFCAYYNSNKLPRFSIGSLIYFLF